MCRATAEELIKEYKACESPDYITYVRSFVRPFELIFWLDRKGVSFLMCGSADLCLHLRRDLATRTRRHNRTWMDSGGYL